jgi:hypothetical protein
MKTRRIIHTMQIKRILPLSLTYVWVGILIVQAALTTGAAENQRSETIADARARFARARRSLPSHGLYEDIRGTIQVRSKESGPTKEVQQKLPSAARQKEVRVVLAADVESPRPDAWRGLHEGVLFLAGARTGDGALWFPDYAANGKPNPDGGLRFKRSEGDATRQNILLRSANTDPDTTSLTNLILHILAITMWRTMGFAIRPVSCSER